jgi:hypothetical protein
MFRWLVLSGLLLFNYGCACLESVFAAPHQKFCGRDYGDRIHWVAVPSWFNANDCAQLYVDGALWSNLYLGCYEGRTGFLNGSSNLGAPSPNDCKWNAFDPKMAHGSARKGSL